MKVHWAFTSIVLEDPYKFSPRRQKYRSTPTTEHLPTSMTGGLSEPKTRQSTRHRPHLHFVNKYTIGVTYILPVWRKVADHLKIFVWNFFLNFLCLLPNTSCWGLFERRNCIIFGYSSCACIVCNQDEKTVGGFVLTTWEHL